MQGFENSTDRETVDFAIRLADAAASETLKFFRSTRLDVENKQGDYFDPVTQADRAAEKAMRALIDAERPDDGILGEEFDNKESRSGRTWVLDPIDGTRGYVAGTPTWGTLIALSDAGAPIFGIIDQPYIGERFVGGLGVAVYHGPHGGGALGTSARKTLSDATIFTTFPEVGSKEEGAAFHKVAARCRLTRYGMDCYAYALLAAGQIDLVVEAGLQAYDIQGPIAVVEAAGGIVTNWQGGPAQNGGTAIAAATKELHAEAMAFLNG